VEERSIRSVANLTRRDGKEFLEVARKTKIVTRRRVFPLDQANSALSALAAERSSAPPVIRVRTEDCGLRTNEHERQKKRPTQSSVLSPQSCKGRGPHGIPRIDSRSWRTFATTGELDESAPRTLYLRDPIRTVIAHNDSPDVGFSSSINPYRRL